MPPLQCARQHTYILRVGAWGPEADLNYTIEEVILLEGYSFKTAQQVKVSSID